MTMTDPISDMLTRIRNGQKARKIMVAMPASTAKIAVAEVLRDEGYIAGYALEGEGAARLSPKSSRDGEVITRDGMITSVSTFGRSSGAARALTRTNCSISAQRACGDRRCGRRPRRPRR